MLLEHEFMLRKREDAHFSLRSFASQLDIDPTSLSRIMKNSRQATEGTFKKIAARLALSPRQVQLLSRHILAKRGRPSTKNPVVTVEPPSFTAVDHDTFMAISHWYYLAILELTYLKDFQPKTRWISQKLGVTVAEVKTAVETLQRLGFLLIDEAGWHDRFTYFSSIEQNYTSTALKSLQRQILKKAVVALDTMPIEERDQTSATFSIDSQLLPEARAIIKRFRREIAQLTDQSASKDSVYQLSISLFPLTITPNKKVRKIK